MVWQALIHSITLSELSASVTFWSVDVFQGGAMLMCSWNSGDGHCARRIDKVSGIGGAGALGKWSPKCLGGGELLLSVVSGVICCGIGIGLT